MDSRVLEKIHKKMQEEVRTDLFLDMAHKLDWDPEPFMAGVIAGRLYNSFHYQYRRICRRDPTLQETEEFFELFLANQKRHSSLE